MLKGAPGTEDLLEHETRVSLVSPKHPDVLVCLYDVNKFPRVDPFRRDAHAPGRHQAEATEIEAALDRIGGLMSELRRFSAPGAPRRAEAPSPSRPRWRRTA